MNRIKVVMETKGIDELRPSDSLLSQMDIKIHTWNKWVANKKDPEMWQLNILADFLGCPITDLIDRAHENTRV